jgi:Protein of unknown function (DUF2442)
MEDWVATEKTTQGDRATDIVGSPYPPAIVVTKVAYLHDFVIHVEFADGWGRDLDLAAELDGEIFAPLRDIAFFKQVRFVDEVGTAVWPNGADFAPKFLRWEPIYPAVAHVGMPMSQARRTAADASS